MVYNGNGIIKVNSKDNFNMAHLSGKYMGIGAISNFGLESAGGDKDSKGVSPAMESGEGALFVQEKKEKSSTAMENFKEYMMDKQEQAKAEGEDLATKEKEAKEQAKKLSQSISSEELRKLEMMGIDVDNANMTDIMGMVNTLRYNADTQETAELMAKIAVDKGDGNGLTMMGGNVMAGGMEISGVSVGEVVAAENADKDLAVADKLVQEKNIDAASDTNSIKMKEASQNIKVVEFTDNEAIYLLKNNMDLSKENLYKAHYSGVKLVDHINDKLMTDMEPQLSKVIEQAGLSVDGDSMDAAKLLMSNDIPVTTDNLRKYMDMKPYMDKTSVEALIPEKTLIVRDSEVAAKATKLYEDIRSIDVKQVYDMATAGKTVTIAAAVRYGVALAETKSGRDITVDNLNSASSESNVSPEIIHTLSDEALAKLGFTDAKAITAMRQMEELRLSMTSAMAGKLIKLDMNVDTRELTKVVSMLKNIESQMTKEAFYAAGVNPTEEKLNLYQEVSAKVNAVAKAPAGVVAAPLMGEAFTIEGLHRRIALAMAGENGAMDDQTGSGAGAQARRAVLSGQFDIVRRNYEAVGTAPRRDMGDSIAKAFANVKDILNEMNMPVNYETERAVRILGYNQLEITENNINQIIDYDRQVNDMLNIFYPEAVIGMIKDGINPLDVPIDELNKRIRDKNYNNGVTEAKNFATFLRDMEKQGELTPAEREAYVGMYRVMDKLAKSGDREAGYLFANGSRLTVRNLITAMRSRKAAGVDVGIDDSFGMLKDLNVSGKRMDTQIEGGFEINPEIDTEDVDYFKDAYKLLENKLEQFMEENAVELSAVNITAVHAMLNQPGGVYSLVSELLGKMKFSTNTKAKAIDEETENMSKSMMGDDVPVNIADFADNIAMDKILEHLRGNEEMSLKYDDLRANLTELMYRWGAAGELDKMDIATIKTVSAGFNIMSGMSKKDRFCIPVETEQGAKVMNLTIKKDGENPGLVEVNMRTESFGELISSLKSDENGALYGQLVSDSSEGNFALKAVEDSFKEALVAAGYNVDGVEVGSVVKMDLSAYQGITSEKLYQVSVAVVKAMSEIV